MPESYNIIFCSRGNNVINKTSLNAVQYNVNWSVILPKKFKKFHCQFIFKSENYSSGVLTDNGFVGMQGIVSNCYDGLSRTSNLGIIYPVFLGGTNSFYNSTNNDNNDFYIDYPINNLVTIILNKFDGVTPMGSMPNYTLIMNLQGVTDEELRNDNTPMLLDVSPLKLS